MKITALLMSIVFMFFAIILIGASEPGCLEISDDLESQDIENKFNSITNGTETNYASWKGVIGIYGSINKDLCTGTFIDPEVILTAAHCVYLPQTNLNYLNNPENIAIWGGADLLNDRLIYFDSTLDIKVHPTWLEDYTNMPNAVDLALIRVGKSPLIQIPEIFEVRGYSIEIGESGTIVGYGDGSNGAAAGIHRTGTSKIQSIYENTSDRYIELGNPSGTCDGDSGGPFFTQLKTTWQIAGIASYAEGAVCDPMQGSWNVNSTLFRDWINSSVLEWTGHELEGDGTSGDADSDSDSDSANNIDENDLYFQEDSCGCSIVGVESNFNILSLIF